MSSRRSSSRTASRRAVFLLVVVIALGLAFDFTNGFHDTANYVATWVGTRALSPRTAVLISAAANLAGAFVTTAVATTIANGIVDTNLVTNETLLAALLGAIMWNLLTWRIGLPSSSTHALIGGLVGAMLAQSGTSGVEWSGVWQKVIVPGVESPVIGFIGAFALVVLIYRLLHRVTPGVTYRGFRGQPARLRDVARVHARRERRAEDDGSDRSCARRARRADDSVDIPTWVKISAGLTIAAGTYVGGWRIIRTLGQRIYGMQPEHGFASQLAAGSTLWLGTSTASRSRRPTWSPALCSARARPGGSGR